MKRLIIPILLLLSIFPMAAYATPIAPVYVLHINDQIDPATADYVIDSIKSAQDNAAQAVLIEMNTPGGLIQSMQKIVEAFFASPIPIIVYVTPDGATAGSAGTMITMAANVAAMAPASNIGSASPVSSSGGEVGGPTMKRKIFNFMAGYARTVAERRGRNGDWAAKAVTQAANITSKDALKYHVIDYIAKDRRTLLTELDGKVVTVAKDKKATLHTARAPLEDRSMAAAELFLHFLVNPFIVLLLTLLAMYGIIYELAHPGALIPGIVGAICIVLLLYSYSVIPVNAVGFALLVLAVALFVVDLWTPTHGALTLGGIISMFFGLMMLFRTSEGFLVPYWVLGIVTLTTAAFFTFAISLGVRALRNPYISGREGIIGHVGEARTDLQPSGKVFVDGTLWNATSVDGIIKKGEKVEVTQMEGLSLTVRKHLLSFKY